MDVDKIMETAVKGDVDHKLQAMCTLIITLGAERFGVTERPVCRQAARSNQRELKIRHLRQELKTLKRQFRAAEEEERDALSELRQILRTKLITLRRAEWRRRRGKERAKKSKAFITNQFSFTKQLLGQKKSGNLVCPVEEINNHSTSHSVIQQGSKILAHARPWSSRQSPGCSSTLQSPP